MTLNFRQAATSQLVWETFSEVRWNFLRVALMPPPSWFKLFDVGCVTVKLNRDALGPDRQSLGGRESDRKLDRTLEASVSGNEVLVDRVAHAEKTIGHP